MFDGGLFDAGIFDAPALAKEAGRPKIQTVARRRHGRRGKSDRDRSIQNILRSRGRR